MRSDPLGSVFIILPNLVGSVLFCRKRFRICSRNFYKKPLQYLILYVLNVWWLCTVGRLGQWCPPGPGHLQAGGRHGWGPPGPWEWTLLWLPAQGINTTHSIRRFYESSEVWLIQSKCKKNWDFSIPVILLYCTAPVNPALINLLACV